MPSRSLRNFKKLSDEFMGVFEKSPQKMKKPVKSLKHMKNEMRLRIRSDLIFKNGAELIAGWTGNFYAELAKTNFKCHLAVQTRYFSKDVFGTNYLIILGKCKFPNCKSFTCSINDIYNEMAIIEIRSYGKFNDVAHKTFAIRRPISKIQRQQIGKETLSKTGSEIFSQLVSKENPERNTEGNIDFIASLPTIRKIKQEVEERYQLDKDDLKSLDALRDILQDTKPTINNHSPQYLRTIQGDPFHVLWYCDSQLDMLKNAEDMSLYIDATGSVVRKSFLLFFHL